MKVTSKSKRAVPKKYKIEECLYNLTRLEYEMVIKVIPKIIGKCETTVNNYKNIPENSKEEIPYSVGLKLERIFGLSHGDLLHTKISSPTFEEITKKNK